MITKAVLQLNQTFFSSVPQTIHHHEANCVTSPPRRISSYALMLDVLNVPLFTVPSRCDSPRPPRRKRTPFDKGLTGRHYTSQMTFFMYDGQG
jgi:hypothetical protein